MEKTEDTWVLRGLNADDPLRIKTAGEALDLINEWGFLPYFRGSVPGFSLEERTLAEDWWTGDPQRDPWEWRRVIADSRKAAYGKFFQNKSAFISLEWFPAFAAMRRNGFSFDDRWEDGKASYREKRIMDLFAERNEWLAPQLKQRAGFGAGGEKNFAGTVTGLEMKTYLTVKDFRQRLNSKGFPFGWHVSVYATPESLWGEEFITSACDEDPEEIKEKILSKAQSLFPDASRKELEILLIR
ncbi:MAG: hypothetical protein CW338_00350 [Clostridiales bacterium]|nr:hypothetical protein [Clostridiales bacterium]